MAKAILVVHSQPSDPSREDEYNDWYDNTHLPEVCAVPGFVAATRFQIVGDMTPNGLVPPDPSRPAYLAIYEMESDDLEGTLKELAVRSGDGRVNMSDSLSMDPLPMTTLYLTRD
jgi:hypothetical protein